MKRLLIPLVFAGALLGSPQAATSAKSNGDAINPLRCVPRVQGVPHCHYVGAVSPSGSIDFTVKKLQNPETTVIFSFAWELPLKCEDGTFTEKATYVYHSATLKHGHFRAHIPLFYVGFDSPGKRVNSSLDIRGTLSGGTIHRFGRILHSDGSGIASECDSGVLHWAAHPDMTRP